MDDNQKNQSLEKRLSEIEERLLRIEKILGLRKTIHEEKVNEQVIPTTGIELAEKKSLAIIGLYVIELSLILTLVQIWGRSSDIILSAVILILMGALFAFKQFIFKKNEDLELHFRSMSYVTAFLAYLKLNFFIEKPAIENPWLFFSGMSVILLFFLWLERNSRDWYSRFILFILIGATSVLTGNHAIVALAGIAMVYIGYVWSGKTKNEVLFPLALLIVYVSETLYFFNVFSNSLLPLRFSHFPETLPFFMYFALSGILVLQRWRDENIYSQAVTFINVIIGFGLFVLQSIRIFHPQLFKVHLVYFFISLLMASWYYSRIKSRYITFFYAMSAYLALTISILTLFPFPESLLWLCLQSLLVIGTALWYRSKLIILANFFIFLGLFGLSILNSGSNGWIHGTFGITALLSARIINWKKSRLELKTELMRNLYLVSAFIILPVALKFIVPSVYYAYSLAVLASGYFALRIVLGIKKYFYLSAGTILWGIIFLLIKGFGHIPSVHIILSFLVLGLLFILITIYKPRKE